MLGLSGGQEKERRKHRARQSATRHMHINGWQGKEEDFWASSDWGGGGKGLEPEIQGLRDVAVGVMCDPATPFACRGSRERDDKRTRLVGLSCDFLSVP